MAGCAVIYAKHSYYKACTLKLKRFLYRLNDKYECTVDQELYRSASGQLAR